MRLLDHLCETLGVKVMQVHERNDADVTLSHRMSGHANQFISI